MPRRLGRHAPILEQAEALILMISAVPAFEATSGASEPQRRSCAAWRQPANNGSDARHRRVATASAWTGSPTESRHD
jgi:hypothetical protein